MEESKIRIEATDEEMEQANKESIKQMLALSKEDQIRAKELLTKLLNTARQYKDLDMDMPFDKNGKVIPLNKWAKSLETILSNVERKIVNNVQDL